MVYEFCLSVSKLLNRLSGGTNGQTLCARLAKKFGHDCLFCRVIGAVVNDADHCWKAYVLDLRRGRYSSGSQDDPETTSAS